MSQALRDNWRMKTDFPSYKPSAFYFRRALRETSDPAQLRQIGLCVVRELEQLKAWIRDEHGLTPPKLYVLKCEAREKGWPSEKA